MKVRFVINHSCIDTISILIFWYESRGLALEFGASRAFQLQPHSASKTSLFPARQLLRFFLRGSTSASETPLFPAWQRLRLQNYCHLLRGSHFGLRGTASGLDRTLKLKEPCKESLQGSHFCYTSLCFTQTLFSYLLRAWICTGSHWYNIYTYLIIYVHISNMHESYSSQNLQNIMCTGIQYL